MENNDSKRENRPGKQPLREGAARIQARKRKKRNTVIIICSVLLALLLAGGAYAWRLLYVLDNPEAAFPEAETRFTYPTTPKPLATPQGSGESIGAAVGATPSPTATPSAVGGDTVIEKDSSYNRINILIIGFDESPERNDEDSELYRDENNNFRSDVMMVLSVNFGLHQADLISVPRDTYAPIYRTNGRWKINAAFAKGGSAVGDGFTYAKKTVGKLLGVDIPYHVGINMGGLKAAVDAIGGVDYDVDVRIELNGRVLEKGFQHLTGQQVLDYCRARKGISTDVGRNDRQQRMLMTIFQQMKEKGQLSDILSIYSAVSSDMYTDLSTEQLVALAGFAKGLRSDELYRHTLTGNYMSAYNASYYVLDRMELEALVWDVFGNVLVPDERYFLDFVIADKEFMAQLDEGLVTPSPEPTATPDWWEE